MNTLLSKNLVYFLVGMLILILCSFPLFYQLMIHFYTEDIDELVEYRKNDFIETYAKTLKVSDIYYWNMHNPDIKILPSQKEYTLDKIVQEYIYSPSDKGIVAHRTLYTPISIEEKKFVLMSRTALIEPDDLMHMILYQYGLLSLILIICLSLIQWRISRKLWKPFYNSLEKSEKFNLEKGVMPSFVETDIIEFMRLNENLKTLMTNNLSVYKRQKEFIENASHELQTPLAVFSSQLDILLQDSNLTREQTSIIQSLYDSVLRLTRLNKNLLLLARIDNNQYKEVEEIDLNQFLEQQLDHFAVLAGSSGVAITTYINAHVMLSANRILLESLINNLLVNAIRHNVNAPEARIAITLGKSFFMVENTGDTTPLDTGKIFRRFSRESEHKKGNGLGLSIMFQICKFHGWEIHYVYQDDMHRFKIDF